MLEAKIGEIEEHPRNEWGDGLWKFILAEEDGSVVLYAGVFEPLKKRGQNHSHIAAKQGLEKSQVLGGGIISYRKGVIGLEDASIIYGSVPNDAMEQFVPLLFEEMKDKYGIKAIKIDMGFAIHLPNNIERWRELGFEFSNSARLIEMKAEAPKPATPPDIKCSELGDKLIEGLYECGFKGHYCQSSLDYGGTLFCSVELIPDKKQPQNNS